MPSSSKTWQSKLAEACRDNQLTPPEYQFVSDRRGGRTAWSSRVIVYGTTLQARYWYDGKNLHNAKEDAAEVAYTWLTSASSPSTSGSGWS